MGDPRFDPSLTALESGTPLSKFFGPSAGVLSLLFRPTRFFHRFADHRLPWLTAIAAYALGVAGTVDRLDGQALKAELGGGGSLWQRIAGDWGVYWLVCLLVGVLSGGAHYLLGGWWYRTRLRLSGAVDADRALARRVYVVSGLAYTIPALLYTLRETSTHSSPERAFGGDDPWALLVLGFLFWSIVVSYRGARALFPVRAWASRLWFLLLPLLAYSFVLVGVALALLLGRGLLDRVPRIDEPKRLDHPALTLRYPGNWQVDRSEESDGKLSIQPFLDDAAVHLFVYDFPLNTQEAAEATRESMLANFTVIDSRRIERWGRFDGHGFDLWLRASAKGYHARTFSTSRGSVSFEVIEICESGAENRLEPGFSLVRDSFVFRPKKVVAALEEAASR